MSQPVIILHLHHDTHQVDKGWLALGVVHLQDTGCRCSEVTLLAVLRSACQAAANELPAL